MKGSCAADMVWRCAELALLEAGCPSLMALGESGSLTFAWLSGSGVGAVIVAAVGF